MRAKEVLYEDYSQRLDSDLNNLLIGAKGNGAQAIPTEKMVSTLQGMGYSVDANSIMAILQNNPGVANVTPESITLTTPESANGGGQAQDSAARVSDMAAKATKIG
jgi:hypothetical protein